MGAAWGAGGGKAARPCVPASQATCPGTDLPGASWARSARSLTVLSEHQLSSVLLLWWTCPETLPLDFQVSWWRGAGLLG